jgi:hypothetical protein
VYVKADLGLAAVVVADQDYPNLAAFSIITKVRVRVTTQAYARERQTPYRNGALKGRVMLGHLL